MYLFCKSKAGCTTSDLAQQILKGPSPFKLLTVGSAIGG